MYYWLHRWRDGFCNMAHDGIQDNRSVLEYAPGIPSSCGNHLTALQNSRQLFSAMLAAVENGLLER